jgi:hypothetical protein
VRIASFRFPLSAEAKEELVASKVDTIVCLNVLEHIEDIPRRFATLQPSFHPAAA